MKIVRGKVTEHYKDTIDFLYDFQKKDLAKTHKIKAISASGKIVVE